MSEILKISKLNVVLAESRQSLITDVDLQIKAGTVNWIMGPNGSGKSTLAKVLAGHPSYEITSGNIEFAQQDLLAMDPTERSLGGIFVAFQYPVEVPGVNYLEFLRMAYNARHSEDNLLLSEFRTLANEWCEKLGINSGILDRNLNEGFSGGEKKQMEILQLALLQPRLVILDETDSGLDIDALKRIYAGINTIRESQSEMTIILITHYPKLLELIPPQFVTVLKHGQVVATGGIELAEAVNAVGYQGLNRA